MFLAGDVGGTKTRLALYERTGDNLKRLNEQQYVSADFKSLEDIISGFLSAHPANPTSACFGVPGPVVAGHVKVTNLPWEMSEVQISKSLGIPVVKLVNDLVSTAAAIPAFTSQDLLTLHPGNPPEGDGVAAVVAPGTGLGQAFLVKQNGSYAFLPSEGGHSNFAPTNDLQYELARYINKRYGHVSVERVLCGPGLVNIYDFLKESGFAKEPQELTELMKQTVPAAVITTTGQKGEFELTKKALEVFVDILGAHAGNVMITTLATKGIYLGGGIPPRITEKLKDGQILKSYFDKGKMAKQLEAAPLHVIKDDHAALTGSARIASMLK